MEAAKKWFAGLMAKEVRHRRGGRGRARRVYGPREGASAPWRFPSS